jgi:hypothetical protein
MTRDVPAELEAHIEREPNSGCWLWNGGHNRIRGYGHLHFRGRQERAHRASWIAMRGPIPPGIFVCHHCDTPECVNPNHLFLGTAKDNAQDFAVKARRRRELGIPQPLPRWAI